MVGVDWSIVAGEEPAWLPPTEKEYLASKDPGFGWVSKDMDSGVARSPVMVWLDGASVAGVKLEGLDVVGGVMASCEAPGDLGEWTTYESSLP